MVLFEYLFSVFLILLFQFETLLNSDQCVSWQANIPNDDKMHINPFKKPILILYGKVFSRNQI